MKCRMFDTPKKVGNHCWPRWTPSSLVGAQGKLIQRVLKIHASTNSSVKRLCDFKIYAISVLSLIGSVCAPDKATLKAENHALQCITASPSRSWLHMCSRKFKRHVGTNALLLSLSLPSGRTNLLFSPRLLALLLHLILFVGWTVMIHLTKKAEDCHRPASGQTSKTRLCWTSFQSCFESRGTDQPLSCC